MLEFFRKYQKIFFVFITVVIVVSFSFFGTYGAMGGKAVEEKDVDLGSSIDGSAMSKREIDRMVRFLGTDQFDAELMAHGLSPNFFNDGVIRSDLLSTGIGQMLAENYFELLAKDVEGRLERAKRYRPYRHPQAEFVSAESMWGQFVPTINEKLVEIKKCDEGVKAFRLLTTLYLEENKFPSYLLRRFLAYQQNQHTWLQKDPQIQGGDLALLHFHTMEDWFGGQFVELACQFIHNVAIYAKQQGYKVTAEEARSELLRNGLKALQTQQEEEVSSETLTKAWRHQLAMTGIDDKAAVAIWQKVMLFRRVFDEVGSSVVLDRLTYTNYHDFSSQACDVEIYKLPESLAMHDLRDVLKLQRYLQLVTFDGSKESLDLPTKMLDTESVRKRAPELVQKRYLVELGSVDKESLGLDVGLREMWEWQTSHWDLMCKESKQLKNVPEEERMGALESLSDSERKKVDAFARKQIVEAHPEWVIDALADLAMQEVEIAIPFSGECAELPGVAEPKKVMQLLDKGSGRDLEQYTQDGRHFHRIVLREKLGEAETLSYVDANSKGILDQLLDKHLEKEYPNVRIANPVPFRKEDGTWKPFGKVRDEVGRYCYGDLLKRIEKEYRKVGGKLEKGSLKEEGRFYAKHRFYGAMEKAHAALKKGDESFLNEAKGQWKLAKETRELRRNERIGLSDDRLFTLEEGEVSELCIGEKEEEISFCRVLNKRESDSKAVAKDVKRGQRLMADDAKRNFMTELLETVKEKDCIHLERHTT